MIILPFRPDAGWRHPPIGTVAVMLTLLLIHISWGRGDPEALKPYLLSFQSFDPLQWLTSAFLHADWLHLIGNLVFLFVFGAIVEDFLGRWFVPVYLLLAIAAGAVEQCLSLLGNWEGCALGASSAIYGVIALAVLWAPQTRVSTLVWLIFYRPLIVEIRVLWLAGSYMALEVISVWLQGGRPSSEILHACGIAVGLPFGLLCLRKRWIDTDGGDLLAPERPKRQTASAVAPIAITPSEQEGRLTAAVQAGDRRVALAAYDVLRREHPTHAPDPQAIEQLVALCESGLDFHRAAAIAEHAVASKSASDTLRLRLARLRGQHLGDAAAGLAHLLVIRGELLDEASHAEYLRLRDRLERRRQTERIRQPAPIARMLLVLFVLAGAARGGEADDQPTTTIEPFAEQPADPFAPPAAQPERQPALPLFEPTAVSGRLAIADGVSLTIPDDLVYLSWSDVQSFLATPSPEAGEETPMGLIISDEQFTRLSADRAAAESRADWERTCVIFQLSEGPIQVLWEAGWIDPAEGLPSADQLLADFQAHAALISRRQALGRGVALTIDSWAQVPSFDAAQGVLAWSINTGMTFAHPPGTPGLAAEIAHRCHLGAGGVLRLICEGRPNNSEAAERMQRISAQVRWEPGRGFTATQPAQVGERTGGFRRVMLPRLVFGDPAADVLVYRNRGLGYAWLIVLLPIAVALFIIMRRIRAASRVAPVVEATANRCPACATTTTPGAARCGACGTSLITPSARR